MVGSGGWWLIVVVDLVVIDMEKVLVDMSHIINIDGGYWLVLIV